MYSIKYFDHNTIQHIQYNVHAYNKFMYKYVVVKDHKVLVIYIINIIDKFTLPFKKTCPWYKCYFLLFLGMVMYDNESETKEKKLNQG